MKKERGKFIVLLLFAIIFFTSIISADSNFSLSDQGSNIKYKSNGSLVNAGNLEVSIWGSLSGNDLVYNETFLTVINNGSWNVMLGENLSNPLSLEFGKKYYKDYKINGQDLNFTDNNGVSFGRQYFYSPLGNIQGSQISSNANLTIANLTVSGNLTTVGTGFFSFLGSLVSRINNLFVNNIDFNGIINGSGNITTTGRIGIGTESPSNSLDVRGTGNFSGLIYFNNATPIDAINSTAQQALTINTTANIQQLLNSTGIYNNAGNASWNQSFANTLYYSITNPNNYINSSANNSYYLSTNPSGYFNSSNYYSYNATYANYAANVSRNWTLDVWNNWGNSFSGNASWNESYARTIFAVIGSGGGIHHLINL